MWDVTHNKWHMTGDMWRGVNLLSKFQLTSSYGLEITMYWIYFHKSSLNVLINDEGVCRTAPATPGLLKIYIQILDSSRKFYWKICLLKYVFYVGHFCLYWFQLPLNCLNVCFPLPWVILKWIYTAKWSPGNNNMNFCFIYLIFFYIILY